eukprot:2555697-Alexandrium_andersonii.AAC.1
MHNHRCGERAHEPEVKGLPGAFQLRAPQKPHRWASKRAQEQQLVTHGRALETAAGVLPAMLQEGIQLLAWLILVGNGTDSQTTPPT